MAGICNSRCYVLARVDVSGVVPVVVSVNHYGEQYPTSHMNYRWWKLGEGEGENYTEAKAKARKMALEWHDWAEPWLNGECYLPHMGR